jgi:heme/copper-type cytochrome/quinol oxidase subunit 4
MAYCFVKGFLVRAKGYLRLNWGAPYIVGFMLLLLSAAASLSVGSESLADLLAVYAYYFLVAGVVLQLVCFLKCSKDDSEKV